MSIATPASDTDGRARLLRAAFVLFAEQGVESVSVRTIAERAGVTAGLVTHHFGSKDKLTAEVDAYALGLCTDILDAAMALIGQTSVDDQGPIGGVQDAITDALVREPVLRRYIGRRLVSDSDAGRQFFQQVVVLVEVGLRQLREAGVVRQSVDHAGSIVLVVHVILGPIVLERQWSHVAGIDSFDPRLVGPAAAAAHAVLASGLFEPPAAGSG